MYAGVGAVLCGPNGKKIGDFSQQLPADLLETLSREKKQTIIFECEFLALLCALQIWGHIVSPAVVIYADNNGVRDSMISCHTSNNTARMILVASWLWSWRINCCHGMLGSQLTRTSQMRP